MNNLMYQDQISEYIKQNKILEKKLQQSDEQSQIMADFLANMSHEIRAPLNAIMGFTHLLQRTCLNAKQDDYVNKIESAAFTLLQIVNDILDYSKMDIGQLQLENTVFNLENVLDRLTAIIGMNSYQKGLDLVICQDPDIPCLLEGDPMRLTQILLNLMSNAVKFSEKGEIFVHISTGQKREEKVYLIFEVKDQGTGLNEEQKSMIKEIFSQSDISFIRKQTGTGLGLVICKQLVELMGGSIGVDSKFGQGSNFHFTVPFRLPVQETSQPYKLPPYLENTRILIIEESINHRDVLATYIKGFGFRSIACVDKSSALALIKTRQQFDLIMVGCRFSGIEGINMLRKIKNVISKNPLPKIIMLTSNMRDSLLYQAKKEGFSEVLIKPINQSQLFDTITSLLLEESTSVPSRMISPIPKSIWNIAGSRILLAEDSKIDQQLICEILMNEGSTVTVVPNGLEALNELKKHTHEYHIILMDLHMPVMDGYEAAYKIRHETGLQIPIIALSADAMPKNHGKVLNSGVQDFISKPFRPDDLLETIQKWLSKSAVDENKDPSAQFDQAQNESAGWVKLFENNGMDALLALKQLNGNVRLYHKMLDRFLSYQDIIVDFEFVNQNNLNDKIRIAHTMKGLADSVGAVILKQHFSVIERLLKENRYESNEFKNELGLAGSHMAQLAPIIKQLLNQQRHLTEDRQSELLPADASLDCMRHLLNLLQDNDTEARRLYDDLLPYLEHFFDSTELGELTRYVGDYDFEEAGSILKARLNIQAKVF